jgi:nucleotide-binding universal stress UspA family protein
VFKRILIPLDGSSRAERAIPLAARLASASHSSIVLLRVIGVPMEYGAYTDPPPFIIRHVLEEDRIWTNEYLNRVAASPYLAGIATQTQAIPGIPSRTIPAVVSSQQIDLVVMCSHGDIGFKRWMVGSVAEEVIHHSPVPVLVLHQDGSDLTPSYVEAAYPLRALVALDGSAEAAITLQPTAHLVAALSAPAHGEIHLVQVVQPASASDEANPEKREQVLYEAQKYLQSVAADLYSSSGEKLNLKVTWSVIVGNPVSEVLIRAAEHGRDEEGNSVCKPCDLIALATRPRSDLERLTGGSVTDRVLGYTQLPLLVVRRHEQPTHTHSEQAQTASTTSGH